MITPTHSLKVIGTAVDESIFGIDRVFKPGLPIIAKDNSKFPYTGQPNGTSHVYLFRDMITAMKKFVDKYGDRVGYTNHHCGMGQWSKEIVVIEPLPGSRVEMELKP